jgi:hypothetical protein
LKAIRIPATKSVEEALKRGGMEVTKNAYPQNFQNPALLRS